MRQVNESCDGVGRQHRCEIVALVKEEIEHKVFAACVIKSHGSMEGKVEMLEKQMML